MLTASVKLLVTAGSASRYHAWKFQVSPKVARVKPDGVGIAARSTRNVSEPAEPDRRINLAQGLRLGLSSRLSWFSIARAPAPSPAMA